VKNFYIVAAIGAWNKDTFDKYIKEIPGNWYFASTPNELNKLLETVNPKYIFFPHWRWVVPKVVIEEYECICFHMTDVPYGRGGSPLQNLIVRGHKKTVLSALRMEEGIDTGPVYFKEPLRLEGTAQDVFRRASKQSWRMIAYFISENPLPIPQKGEVTLFKRRKKEESLIPEGLSLEQVFDYIRMLDAPDYPKAFIENENYRFEFEAAQLDKNELTASVKITLRNIDENSHN